MGMRDWFRSTSPAPAATNRGTLSIELPGDANVASFMRSLLGSRNMGSPMFVDSLASQYGGRVVRSFRGRELVVYGEQQVITHGDREYLKERDPLGIKLTRGTAIKSWFAPPRTYEPVTDDFFQSLRRLRFNQASIAADTNQGAFGGAFLYLRAGGNPKTPLQRGDRPLGYDFISLGNLAPDPVIWDESGDEMLRQHGIEFLTLNKPVPGSDAADDLLTIHGSRIIGFVHNPESRTYCSTPILDAAFNDLWALRDHYWNGLMASRDGAPINIEVDLDHPEAIDLTTAEQQRQFEDDLRAQLMLLRNGQNQSIITRGVKVTRLSKADIHDRTLDIHGAADRIAAASEVYTPEQILRTKMTAAETDVTLSEHEGLLLQRMQSFCLPIYEQAFLQFKAMGLVAKKATLPIDLDWPRMRRVDERQLSVADRSDAMTLRMAFQSGRLPPARILSRFPVRPEGILPLQAPSDEQLENNIEVAEIKAGDDPNADPTEPGEPPVASP